MALAFTASQAIGTGNRVGRGGRVNIQARFHYNTRFPQEFSKDPQVRRVWKGFAAQMEATARHRVPVGATGRLKASIKSSVIRSPRNGIIQAKLTAGGSGVRYWAYVEYGTGARGAASPQHEPGTPVGWRYGRHPGTRAQPYLRPALLAFRSGVGTAQIATRSGVTIGSS